MDPLPPFVADMRTADGKPIGVIRVFASTDVPHIVRGTGAVYVRSSKGKEPVDDHRTLLELARRGEEAEVRARRRLFELPPVGWALRPPDWRPPGVIFAEEVGIRYIVRAAPLTVTPALAQWPLTRQAAESLVDLANVLLPPSPPRRVPFSGKRRKSIHSRAGLLSERRSTQGSSAQTRLPSSRTPGGPSASHSRVRSTESIRRCF